MEKEKIKAEELRFSIENDRFVFISKDIAEIKNECIKLVKKKQTATIYKNGINIGWIGEDLSQRIGWGYLIND